MNLIELKRKSIHLLSLLIPFSYRYLTHYNKKISVLILFLVTLIIIIIEMARLENYTFRRFFNRWFGDMMRKHEALDFSGATFLMISSIISIAFFPRNIAFNALVFLAIGDTFAALIGKRFGKRKLFGSKKSLEGSLACFASTLIFAIAFDLNPIIAFVGALSATVAEFSRIPLDDNIKIPIFSGLMMTFASLFIW